MTTRWIAALGPDEDVYRAHAEEPDAVDAFMCGLPPEGTKYRALANGDELCGVCEFLASPMGLFAVAEGRKIRLREMDR